MLLCAVMFLKNPYWLAIDSCFDNDRVWDDDEKRCRDDCFKWNKDYGCIKLTTAQIATLKECITPKAYISEKFYQDVCFNNNKAWNINTKNCKFDFTYAECFKLVGSWEYPKICN